MNARLVVCTALLMGTGVAALCAQERPAQQRPQESPAVTVDPKACAPGDRMQAGERNPSVPATSGEALSDRLARTDGVICPPNVDPGIKAPTPDVGTMPIIPPPGSPGGDPSVRPK